MYFRQFLGRIVRRVSHISALQVAYCYLPADPTLTRLAEEIEEEIRHCVRPRGTDQDEFERERRARNDDQPEKPHWEVLQSHNSGIDSVIVHGNQLSLFGGLPAPDVLHQVVAEKVHARLDERRTRSEEKALLAQEIRKLVSIYHKRTRQSHAQIHAHLNALQKLRARACALKRGFESASSSYGTWSMVPQSGNSTPTNIVLENKASNFPKVLHPCPYSL